MEKHRIFTTSFASIYPYYVQKAERKNRTKEEVDKIISWLTGYDRTGLKEQLRNKPISRLFSTGRQSSIRMLR